jgi:cytochrome oxidase Cu insertion factor (SCO1/SenC/PrrC family)
MILTLSRDHGWPSKPAASPGFGVAAGRSMIEVGRKKSEESQIRRLWMAVNIGDNAPDFTLPSTVGDTVTLSELLREKPVVLTFYQFDFTGDEERG